MEIKGYREFVNIGRTEKSEKDQWIVEAKAKGAKYIMVVCDTFDYVDYPMYIGENDDIYELYEKYSKPDIDMQDVYGIYDVSEKYKEIP